MIETIRPVRNPDIQMQDLGGESLLYTPERKAIHVLNPTALLIWNLCDGVHTIEEIEQAIRQSFSVKDGYDLAADIRRTLDTFAAKDLIQDIRTVLQS